MKITKCRLCQSKDIEKAIDLGFHPVADTFLDKENQFGPEVSYPLQLGLCESCGHVFTLFSISPEERYQKHDYSYDSSNSNISVSPYYLGFNNRPIHKSSPHGLMMKLFHYCMNGRNGYQPGKIAKSGINYGINKISLKKEEGCVSVDWQPGGCILHKRSNLIKENYFPYRGKAYSEDLIHSYLLRKKGVKLLVNLDAYCFISSDIQFEKLGELFLDFKSRFYFVKMAGLSKPRLFVYYMIFSIKYFLRKINII